MSNVEITYNGAVGYKAVAAKLASVAGLSGAELALAEKRSFAFGWNNCFKTARNWEKLGSTPTSKAKPYSVMIDGKEVQYYAINQLDAIPSWHQQQLDALAAGSTAKATKQAKTPVQSKDVAAVLAAVLPGIDPKVLEQLLLASKGLSQAPAGVPVETLPPNSVPEDQRKLASTEPPTRKARARKPSLSVSA